VFICSKSQPPPPLLRVAVGSRRRNRRSIFQARLLPRATFQSSEDLPALKLGRHATLRFEFISDGNIQKERTAENCIRDQDALAAQPSSTILDSLNSHASDNIIYPALGIHIRHSSSSSQESQGMHNLCALILCTANASSSPNRSPHRSTLHEPVLVPTVLRIPVPR